MSDTCMAKHAKWAVGIFITVVLSVLAMSWGIVSSAAAAAKELEPRVRKIETDTAASSARSEAKFDSILQRLDTIASDLKAHRRETP